MGLRVALLSEATPFAWVPQYVDAFRQCCEVITIGPSVNRADLQAWGLRDKADRLGSFDIDMPLEDIQALDEVLPAGWAPQLVVAIASNGIPMFRNTAPVPCPTALITVDTCQCLTDFHAALHYDFVFCAQKEFCRLLESVGCRHVAWLPLGCTPGLHREVEASDEYDVAFAGGASSLIHIERRFMIECLKEHFSVLQVERVDAEKLSAVFARGKVAFNHAVLNELNMRIFEVLAMGRPLVTNRQSEQNGLFDLFEKGIHLATYASSEELVEVTSRLLADEQWRRAIACAGRDEVLSRHTYVDRVKQLLATVDEHVGGLADSGQRKQALAPSLAGLMPWGMRRVADVGLCSRASKYALRTVGVEEYFGVSFVAGAGTRKRSRYDVLMDWGSGLPGELDCVMVSDWKRMLGHGEAGLRRVHDSLVDGGALIGLLTGGFLRDQDMIDEESVIAWFRHRGFRVTHGQFVAGDASRGRDQVCLVVAKRASKSIADVGREILSRHPIIGQTVFTADYLDKLPEGF